jgi:hypothetical protein
MRYRQLDAKGDYVLGFGQGEFYVNQPEAVAQAVLTRLKLYLGEWFIDITDGTDWFGSVLGNNTVSLRDVIIKTRILDTNGVNSILSFNSTFNSSTRSYTANVVIDTIYGVFPNTTIIGAGSSLPTSSITTPSGIVQMLNFTLDSPTAGLLDKPFIRLG